MALESSDNIAQSRISRRVDLAMGETPTEDQGQGFGDLVSASMRRENLGASFLNRFQPGDYEPVEGFEVPDSSLAGWEPWADKLMESRSPQELAARKASIEGELRDQDTISKAGFLGIATSFGAGFSSPENLLPMGFASNAVRSGLKGARLSRIADNAKNLPFYKLKEEAAEIGVSVRGKRGRFLSREAIQSGVQKELKERSNEVLLSPLASGVATVASGVPAAALGEGLFQSTQDTRSTQESVIAVTATGIFSLVAGGLGQAFKNRAMIGAMGDELANGKLLDQLSAMPDEVTPTLDEFVNMTPEKRVSTFQDLLEQQGDGGAELIKPGGPLAKAMDWMLFTSPAGRTSNSGFDSVKKLAWKVLPTPFVRKGTQAGESVGPSLEMTIRGWQVLGTASTHEMNTIRKAANLKGVPSETFREAVATAMRNGDKLPDGSRFDFGPGGAEAVAAAAAAGRKFLDTLSAEAQKVGLLSKLDLKGTAESYFPRLIDRKQILNTSRANEMRKRIEQYYAEQGDEASVAANKATADVAGLIARADSANSYVDQFSLGPDSIGPSGRIKDRTMLLPDSVLEPILVNDTEFVMSHYARSLAGQIEYAKLSPTYKTVASDMVDEVALGTRGAKTPAEVQALGEQIDDLHAAMEFKNLGGPRGDFVFNRIVDTSDARMTARVKQIDSDGLVVSKKAELEEAKAELASVEGPRLKKADSVRSKLNDAKKSMKQEIRVIRAKGKPVFSQDTEVVRDTVGGARLPIKPGKPMDLDKATPSDFVSVKMQKRAQRIEELEEELLQIEGPQARVDELKGSLIPSLESELAQAETAAEVAKKSFESIDLELTSLRAQLKGFTQKRGSYESLDDVQSRAAAVRRQQALEAANLGDWEKGTGFLGAFKRESEAAIKAAPTQKEADKIRALRDRDLSDVRYMRDYHLGRLSQGGDPTNNLNLLGKTVRTMTYMARLGMQTISSIPDLGAMVFVNGWKPTGRVLWNVLKEPRLLIKQMDNEELGRMVGLFEYARHAESRHKGWVDLFDPNESRASTFENTLDKAADLFTTATGVRNWNGFWKRMSAYASQDRIVRTALKMNEGKAISRFEKEAFALAGLNADDAAKIAEEFSNGGGFVDGKLHLLTTSKWRDTEAADRIRAAVMQDVRRTIITPSGTEVPKITAENAIAKAALQFKTFSLASNQNYTVSALGRRDAQVFGGMSTMVGLGMMSTFLHDMISDREEKSFEELLLSGVERSGVLALFSDANFELEAMTAGRAGLRPALGLQSPGEYFSKDGVADRNVASLGYLSDSWEVMGGLFKNWSDGTKISDSQLKAASRLAPFSTLPYTKGIVSRGNKYLVDQLGLPTTN